MTKYDSISNIVVTINHRVIHIIPIIVFNEFGSV